MSSLRMLDKLKESALLRCRSEGLKSGLVAGMRSFIRAAGADMLAEVGEWLAS